jgi:hypothetical protein
MQIGAASKFAVILLAEKIIHWHIYYTVCHGIVRRGAGRIITAQMGVSSGDS